MIVFLDTNIVIYFVELPAGFGPRARRHLANRHAGGDTFAVSDLVRLECRVLPIRNNDQPLLSKYDQFFNSSDLRLLPLTSTVCERATTIRAALNFGLADSIQLAAAIVHGCDRFLTADARLQRCTDIPVDLLP